MLSKAERLLGLDSRSVSIEPNIYSFTINQAWNPFRNRIFSLVFREILRWPLLLYACFYADVVHYNFGQTIMPQWYGSKEPRQMKGKKKLLAYLLKGYVLILEHFDVMLLKAMGKKIVITCQGDDVRQGDYCRSHYKTTAANFVGKEYYTEVGDNNKRRLIARMAYYADKIYALNPDLLNVLPDGAKFFPYVNVGLTEIVPVSIEQKKRPLVIHAPTHREVKGTEFILSAVKRLQDEKIEFDFKLVEGLSHENALKIYENADLLIDQLLIGWYGGLAVELMAMGKPVICYLREDDLSFIPGQMRQQLPIINANPDNIYDVLKAFLLLDYGEQIKLGKKCRQFVESWHDPMKVASQLKIDYESLFQ